MLRRNHRSSNPSLFVTVLFGCLGLLVIGVSPDVAARTVSSGVRHTTEALHSRLIVNAKVSKQSTFQSHKRVTTKKSAVSLSNANNLADCEAVLYQNTRALIENTRVLLVTHLPRAALSDSPANEPAMS